MRIKQLATLAFVCAIITAPLRFETIQIRNNTNNEIKLQREASQDAIRGGEHREYRMDTNQAVAFEDEPGLRCFQLIKYNKGEQTVCISFTLNPLGAPLTLAIGVDDQLKFTRYDAFSGDITYDLWHGPAPVRTGSVSPLTIPLLDVPKAEAAS